MKVDATLELVFDENIRKGNGKITIAQENKGTQSINVNTGAVQVTGKTARITPGSPLEYATRITVTVEAGTFTDEAGNAFSGISNSGWTFRTVEPPVPQPPPPPADNTAPVASSLYPANNAAGVSLQADLVIVFSENVKKDKGTITIQGGPKEQKINVSSAAVSVSGNRATINPPDDFPAGAALTVLAEAGTFTDEAGNRFGGIRENGWKFSTPAPPPPPTPEPPPAPADNIAPVVVNLLPADDATGVNPDANLEMEFSEKIKKGTGFIRVNYGTSSQVIDVAGNAVRINGTRAIIDPPISLPASTPVNVQMPAGIFEDEAGNKSAAINTPTAWNFTTAGQAVPADQTPPRVTEFSPVKNAKDVDAGAKLVMTFSEDVLANTGSITISQGNGKQTVDVKSAGVTVAGSKVTITLATPLPSGTQVNVQMPAGTFRDASGNNFAGITDAATWTFRVAEEILPEVTAFDPPKDAKDVPLNANLTMTFTVPVKKGTGNITISQGTGSQVIDVNSMAVRISGSTVTIDPPADLPPAARITVQMPKGVLKDTRGNDFAGITNAETWFFNTLRPPSTERPQADKTPPVAQEFNPEDNATGVPTNTDLTMTFSKNIRKGRGIILVSYGGTQIPVDVTSAAVSVTGNQATINPPGDFPMGAAVNVQMPPGTFTDESGNPFGGISNPSIWNFRVYHPSDDLSPLRIVSTRFPAAINDNAASVEAFVRVNQLPPGTTAELIYRGIASPNWNRVAATVSFDNLRVTTPLQQAWFDEIGLEYYYEIRVFSTIRIYSDRGYTYRNYTGTGLTVPDMRFGSTAASYQILSIPLELKDPSVEHALEDNLGSYNPRKWRLFAYGNGVLQEYQQGFTTLQPSQGYWLIVKDQRNITTGEGSTHKVYQDSPYVVRLQKGWNQIGNPYNFNVVWGDVKAYNRNPAGLGNLRVFENGFKNTDTLKLFRGAFVFAENEMTISLPVLKNRAANAGGRVSAEKDARGRISQEEVNDPDLTWLVNFDLHGAEVSYRLGGLGMHRQASLSKDQFDEMTVPRFGNYLEMNFDHPEYFARRFTRDIVPTAEEYTWSFTVAAQPGRQTVRMNWEGLFDKIPAASRVYLFDEASGKAVDMRRQSSYAFRLDSTAAFRVLYGPDEYVRKNLPITEVQVAEPFPNPFVELVQIPVSLPGEKDTYSVSMQIYSLQGALIYSERKVSLESGIHYFTWKGTDSRGGQALSGMYVCRMEVTGPGIRKEFTRKIIVK